MIAMERQLLFSVTKKDLKIETFRSGGPGGQRRDKKSTAVRITHPASGAQGIGKTERSREQNMRAAFRRMAESDTFKKWVRIRTGHVIAYTSERLDEMMRPENLRVELKVDGRWCEEPA